jgi:2-polyprenyl-3-methyl-5-hydroxy-6-metoxy-1,4-benzoquinol methylase
MHTSPVAFGSETQFLNNTIVTATQMRYDLKNKRLVKLFLRLFGLPHFGARLRAYHLSNLLKKLPKHQLILDAGSGIGLNSFLLSRYGHKIVGIDTDAQKIKLANIMKSKTHNASVTFRPMDMTRMQFSNKRFNSVLCFEVLEHIKNDHKAISELSRVIKPNGTLLLSTPAKGVISKINKKAKHHVREGYDISELTDLLTKNSFSVQQVIAIEHSFLGFYIRYINDELGRRSLGLVTLFFPLFLPLGILDSFLPISVKPNNWIIIAKKS